MSLSSAVLRCYRNQASGIALRALSCALSWRTLSSASSGAVAANARAVYIADADSNPSRQSAFLLGLVNYFERHLPFVGFFIPVAGPPLPGSSSGVDRHVELIHQAFDWKFDVKNMMGVSEEEATRAISLGKGNDVLDKIYAKYAAYKEQHDVVVIEGTKLGGDMDAQISAALNAPVLLTVAADPNASANDMYNEAMLRLQVFREHKVDILGVALTKVPRNSHALVSSQLRNKFAASGVFFAGAIPDDPLLDTVRLDEVKAALNADLVFSGANLLLDQEFNEVIVAAQRIEELLEIIEEGQGRRPLVVTTQDRVDLVLGLLAAQMSVQGPNVAGILTTQAGHSRIQRDYSRNIAQRIFKGFQDSSGATLPVLNVDMPMYEAIQRLANMSASILPTSSRKIQQAKTMFDKYVDANQLVAQLEKPTGVTRMTPKMFIHNIKAICLKDPQTIVLPEATDKRILAAASEVTARGLAKIVLLGDPVVINAEANKLGLDISGCTIVDPKTHPKTEHYIEVLYEARRAKNLSHDAAHDLVLNDINMFGVLMVQQGDADGMVSGAIHTTAATVRPAMQVLKASGGSMVSSVFFMCLPDKVLVYGDCAVNVMPNADELAKIAMTSADTAKAFGVDPRVAMLSYSTLGSGAGPDVQKVVDAVAAVKSRRPDLKVEGPIQYDAAIDPAVAAVKIKTASDVAGKATVFIFPDLNTGNNTYKAVQQATGAVAMGPVMQGLKKPVNDLSRGCTVPDIVNTICVTSVQALQAKAE